MFWGRLKTKKKHTLMILDATDIYGAMDVFGNLDKPTEILVGGFKPSEKYESQVG